MSKTGLEIRWTERQKDLCVICIEVVNLVNKLQ